MRLSKINKFYIINSYYLLDDKSEYERVIINKILQRFTIVLIRGGLGIKIGPGEATNSAQAGIAHSPP